MITPRIAAPIIGALLSFPSLASATCRIPASLSDSHYLSSATSGASGSSPTYGASGSSPASGASGSSPSSGTGSLASSGTATIGSSDGTSASSVVSSPSGTATGSVSGSSVSSSGLLTYTVSTQSSLSSATATGTSSAQPSSTGSGNTASNRQKWFDYDINTDYTTIAPDTGVTREYWFDLTEVEIAPDGFTRYAMAINGTIPGPTIYADWGDTVKVHVTNNLVSSVNGTSIHFHGIRQNYTNQNDGVSSITQCPTAPNNTETYTWKAVQYGSTWYHSHFALQAWQGVMGGIVINGPATQNYDEDLGVMFLNDWDHDTVDVLYEQAARFGPPTLDNGLINGTNVYGTDDSDEQTGSRWKTTFNPGTSYRLRLVNGAVDTHFKFMVDNHTMTVIASDLVPIEPYQTTVLNLGMGQRYDVIITADQGSDGDNFWLRAIPQAACSENASSDNIRGIIYYGTDTGDLPTTSAYTYDDGCADETDNLVPWLAIDVGGDEWDLLEEASAVFGTATTNAHWYLNETTMVVEWNNPTLNQIATGADFDSAGSNTFNGTNAVVELPDADQWMYMVISTDMTIPHPIHLHGHDFHIIAQGSDTYNTSTVKFNFSNPPRRDTAMLPLGGYLAIAFKTDNPGAWLMHCHIGWHTSEGFAMQFIERKDEILALTDTAKLDDTCSAWINHQNSQGIEQDDSGI
ncbi:multicopper oxidase-domain-containing protein [Xylariales sp. PMI_506]|nr:multicopper oxidase-domain-containing protein [Xylariales sp. PMI_506]